VPRSSLHHDAAAYDHCLCRLPHVSACQWSTTSLPHCACTSIASLWLIAMPASRLKHTAHSLPGKIRHHIPGAASILSRMGEVLEMGGHYRKVHICDSPLIPSLAIAKGMLRAKQRHLPFGLWLLMGEEQQMLLYTRRICRWVLPAGISHGACFIMGTRGSRLEAEAIGVFAACS